MRIYLYSLKKRLWIASLSAAVYIALVFLQKFDAFYAYWDVSEAFPSLLWACLTAFILQDENEIEFAKCYGFPIRRLFFSQYIPTMLYPTAVGSAVCVISTWVNGALFDSVNIGRLLFSLFVTYLFFTSLALVLRLLFRNSYPCLIGIAAVYAPFLTMHIQIERFQLPASYASIDPFITSLLYNPEYSISYNTWRINRTAYLAFAVLLLLTAVIITGQTKIGGQNGINRKKHI